MKKTITSKSLRLIAFFLVSVILICAFGFSADGWQIKENTDKKEDYNSENNIQNQSTPTQSPQDEDSIVDAEPLPKFYNSLTGLETTEELSTTRHTAFVMNSESPLYGISAADIVIEFPIEDGTTRLLAFINSPKDLVKIGCLEKTRGYISNLAKAFGANIFAIGYDDSLDYPKCEIDERFANEENTKSYIYTEFGRFNYTNGTLVNEAQASLTIEKYRSESQLPFSFRTDGEMQKGESVFNRIEIPYSSDNKTTLIYSRERNAYIIEKNGVELRDQTNSASCEYKNCFVLFADSTTYEYKDSTQMVLNTIGEGCGYYFTYGTALEIIWHLSEDGVLTLLDKDSNELNVNTGKSYISFFKSSIIDEIMLS